MKTARLAVILINFVLIGVLIYTGVKFYVERGFFDESSWEKADINKVLKKDKDLNRLSSREEYESIGSLAEKPIAPPPPPTANVEPETPTLFVEVKGVVFNREKPEKSGAHIVAKGVPRYFMVGDGQKIADDMPYYLKEIREDKPDREYNLIFEDDNGKQTQTKYRKK